MRLAVDAAVAKAHGNGQDTSLRSDGPDLRSVSFLAIIQTFQKAR